MNRRFFLNALSIMAALPLFSVGAEEVSGIRRLRAEFEQHKPEILESALQTFKGVMEGYDVYNCSIPFEWQGTTYILGRVEPRDKWASSVVYLFRSTGRDAWERVLEFGLLELEDPFVSFVQGELVVGGTRVTKIRGGLADYRGAFYRDNGKGPLHLEYFTTGPGFMKDIRLIDMKNGKIGVFSRPRNGEVEKKYGSAAVIGFAQISKLDELGPEVIENAPVIPGVLGQGEWGGVNQAYLNADGTIKVAAHLSYHHEGQLVYCPATFNFDPVSFKASHIRIVATRGLFPKGEAKRGDLLDCAFTSGFVFNSDGTVDIYSGLSDTKEGRIRVKGL